MDLGLKQVINPNEAECLTAVQTAAHVADMHAGLNNLIRRGEMVSSMLAKHGARVRFPSSGR